MNPVVLTGATGFVGRTLLIHLSEAGYSSRAIVRRKLGENELYPVDECVLVDLNASTAGSPEQTQKLSDTLRDAQAIIYCAGSVRGASLEDFLEANESGLANILDFLEQQSQPPPLLLISSLAASRPDISDYAQSKYRGECVLKAHPNLNWTIIRPPALYGTGDKEMRPLFDLGRTGFLPVLGPPDQRIALMHVDDLCTAILAWLNNWQNLGHSTYSIDDGFESAYSWPQIAEIVSGFKRWGRPVVHLIRVPRLLLSLIAGINKISARLLSYKPMLTPGKVEELTQADWLADNTEFTRATGWQPEFGLEAGLKRMYSCAPENR